MALVRTEKLEKSYTHGDIVSPALRGVDLEVGEGEFTALVGPSGSGKTTLLNLVGGLDAPTSGRIHINGQDLTDLSASALSDYRLYNIGFIFQDYNLVPVLTALENVAFIMVLQGRREREANQKAGEYLARVGLEEYGHRRPNALSGGQQQRVAVARALAASPRLVLADEPTANLDTENALSLLELMGELNASEGVTFLFSTHDTRVVERARRVVTLKDGLIDSDETRADN